MKKFVIVYILLVAIAGCKKSTSESFVQKALIGTWELRIKYSGSGGVTTYPAGNGNSFNFHKNGQFTATYTGNLNDTGTYKISPWTNSAGEQKTLLYLGGKWNHEFEAFITNDTLRLDNYSTIADFPVFIIKNFNQVVLLRSNIINPAFMPATSKRSFHAPFNHFLCQTRRKKPGSEANNMTGIMLAGQFGISVLQQVASRMG